MMCGSITNRRGGVSIFIISITTMLVIMIILLFAVCVLNINTYSIVYNYKIDLYNLNRNAIMSVNKVEGKYGIYKYDKEKYLYNFKKLLQKSYGLNDELKNGNRFIKEIKILEYDVLYKSQIDSVSNKLVENDIVHVVTSIEYNPIIFKSLFPNNCVFTLHNDISIRMYE